MAARRVLAGLGAVGLLISGLSSLAAAEDGDGAASAASGESDSAIEVLVPAFDAAQAAEDRLPGDIAETADVVPETARLLGEAEGVTFWAGATAQNEICLISELPNGDNAASGDEPVTGITCTASAVFAERGAAIGVNGYTADHGVEAYLLPAGISDSSVQVVEDELGDGVEAVSRDSTTVLAVNPDAGGQAGGAEIETIQGESITLPGLHICQPCR